MLEQLVPKGGRDVSYASLDFEGITLTNSL